MNQTLLDNAVSNTGKAEGRFWPHTSITLLLGKLKKASLSIFSCNLIQQQPKQKLLVSFYIAISTSFIYFL